MIVNGSAGREFLANACVIVPTFHAVAAMGGTLKFNGIVDTITG